MNRCGRKVSVHRMLGGMQLATHDGHLLRVTARECPDSLYGHSLIMTFPLPHVRIPALAVFIEGFIVGDWDVEGRGETSMVATRPE